MKQPHKIHIPNKRKLKIFQTIQKKLAAMGFSPNQQLSGIWYLSFNQIICSIDAITIGAYIFCNANVIEDYTFVIFSFISVVGITISFISIVIKNDEIYITIKLCEKVLTGSK